MKKMICLQLGVILLLAGFCTTCNRDTSQKPPQKDRIVLNSSPELYKLTREWAGVYCTLNPEVDIEVVSTDELTIAENLDKSAQLNFVTSDFESEIYDQSLWKVVVGREIIVPFINTGNPYIKEISKQGISPAGLFRILNNPEHTLWSTLVENGPDVPVSFYMTDDATLQSGIARFLGTDEVSFSSANTKDPQALVSAVQSDPYAIGICYLTNMIDPQNHSLYDNIQILPIDRNGNGYIDYKENVYSSMDEFARGVWIGRYPSTLSKNIYSVSSAPPAKKSETAFLTWVITSGQVLLDNHGFSDMPEFERQAEVKFIDGTGGQPGPGTYTLPKEPGFFTGPYPYFIAVLLLMTLLLYFRIRISNRRRKGVPSGEPVIPGLAFSENNVEVSPGLYYDKTHTWAYLEKDGTVKVGIDDFLQRVTGPLTRVKMKSPGERVRKGKKAVSIIQDGKQLDISAPVSGTIKEQNTHLTTDSSLLNSSPYAEGWIYKIEPVNWFKEVQFLIMGSSYKKWLKNEFQRLKEFFSDTIRPDYAEYAQVLQDGGELKENILKDLGPETWEDFQTNFIDVS